MGNEFALKGTFVSAPKPDRLEIMENMHLVVQDGRVRGFVKEYGGANVEDYGTSLIIPGLADMHVHAPQFAMRGMGLDLELLPWLETYTFPEESKFADAEYAKEVYTRFAHALVRSGTTRACVFGTIHTETVLLLMDILEETGVSAYVGKVNMDRNAPDSLCEGTEKSLAQTRRWLDACRGRYKNVKSMLTPRFVPSCSDALLKGLGALAKEYGIPVQSHLSENKNEVAWVKELAPQAGSYADAYDRFGLFGDTKTVMAHCVYCTPEEIALMAQKGVMAAHCPDSNSNLASGMANMRAFLNAGVRITLGSDLAGGCSVSILDAMAKAIRTSKQVFALGGGAPLTVAEALHLGTSAGGEFFDKQTGFCENAPLHAVVLDDAELVNTEKLSVSERLQRMVYLYEDRKIEAVYANGKKIINKGELI